MSASRSVNVYDLIFGYEDWANDEIKNGRQLFYLNFMFHPLPGSVDALMTQMHRAIERDFYDVFCRRTCRRPRARGAREYLPKLVAFPDRPIWKRGKRAAPHFSVNGGFHFNGFLSVDVRRRFKETVEDHIQSMQYIYIGRQLCRVHVERVVGQVQRVADYSIKSIKRAADLADYVLILTGEVAAEAPKMSHRERELRDIQSRLNVSDDLAQALLHGPTGDR